MKTIQLTTAELARLAEGKAILIGEVGQDLIQISASDLSCSLTEMVNQGQVATLLADPDRAVAYN